MEANQPFGGKTTYHGARFQVNAAGLKCNAMNV